MSESPSFIVLWLIGKGQTWSVRRDEAHKLNIDKTGDRHKRKICNLCHILLPVDKFQINQRNKHGLIRRPSCQECRKKISGEKAKPLTDRQKRKKPQRGDAFQCPICKKRTISSITARNVVDHDHGTGEFRDFICDSCNTGLGRFKNGQDCVKDLLKYLQRHARRLHKS